MDFYFDSNLRLAKDLPARSLRVGDRILVSRGWKKIAKIRTLKSPTAKTRIQFFCPIGNLIMESFPESEILCGR